MLKSLKKDPLGSGAMSQDSAPPKASPYDAINPDAFSTETDRKKTSVPFPKSVTNWDSTELYTHYTSPQKKAAAEEESFADVLLQRAGFVMVAVVVIGGVLAVLTVGGKNPDELAAAESASQSPGIQAEEYVGPVDLVDTLTPEELSASISDYLAAAQINGVLMRGKDSKISINGSTYRVGEVVMADYELQFLGYHKDRRRAVFQGPSESYYMIDVIK